MARLGELLVARPGHPRRDGASQRRRCNGIVRRTDHQRGDVVDLRDFYASRRGQVSGTQSGAAGHLTVLALAPLSELASYQTRLNSLTGGQGRYTLMLSHYEAVPPTVQSQLAAQYKIHEE